MSTHTMTLPDLGEGVVEAELVSWFVRVGDEVTTQTPIAEVQTDKASVEISAPVAGIVEAILVEEGDLVTVGSDLVRIDQGADGDRPTASPGAGEATDAGGVAEAGRALRGPEPRDAALDHEPRPRPLAAPAVRGRAKELGIDLRAVTGTGPEGRILREDLDAHAAAATGSAAQGDETKPIRGIRRATAEQLTVAWAAPHITYVDEVDVTQLEATRALVNSQVDEQLTPLSFIARAVVLACADHPQMNTTFDSESATLTRHAAVHLGIATQTDRGLLVPVVRDANRRSLSELAGEIRRAAEGARDGSATREELRGSTITVTSLGALGGLMTTPILNSPEVAIVGVNKMRIAPVWNGSSFEPRTVFNLSASFDHRVVDGYDAAVFVQRIKELLENPALLTLGWATR